MRKNKFYSPEKRRWQKRYERILERKEKQEYNDQTDAWWGLYEYILQKINSGETPFANIDIGDIYISSMGKSGSNLYTDEYCPVLDESDSAELELSEELDAYIESFATI